MKTSTKSPSIIAKRYCLIALSAFGLLFCLPATANDCRSTVEFTTDLSPALQSALLDGYELRIEKALSPTLVQLQDQNGNQNLQQQLAALVKIPEVRVAQFRCQDGNDKATEAVSEAATPVKAKPAAANPKTESFIPKPKPRTALPAVASPTVASPAADIPVPPAIIGGLPIETPITECQASILFSVSAAPDNRAAVYESLGVLQSGQRANGAQLVKPFYNSDSRSPEQIVAQAQGQAYVVKAEVVCP